MNGQTEQKNYREVKIGKTIYRVTSFFNGKVELQKVLEDLTVKKALQAQSLCSQLPSPILSA